MKKGKSGRSSNGVLPNSLRIISSCLKTVSSNASSVASTVRSAGASVASSISNDQEQKDQVLWAGFDKLELGPSTSKVYFYLVTPTDFKYLMLRMPLLASQPLLVIVAGDEVNSSNGGQSGGVIRDNNIDPQPGNCVSSPTAVRFYSLRSHSYVHVLRFRSAVYMVRSSTRIVAVGLAAQIHCFDALTLESKFSVLTFPIPQVAGQGMDGVNIGYGPMGVGPRWLAYASNNPLLSTMGRLSPQNLTPSPGVSPSTSPGSGSLVARYAMESSKQLAAGIINLGDMGYKKLSKYCQELLPDGSNSSPVSSNPSSKFSRIGSASETDNAGMVVIKDFVSRAVISQFRAHTSPISALCFDPSGTLLVTASVHGNNINIFRIMPSCVQHGSGTPNYDWSSSHVHLYRLYRGITTAVIQDICFSHYSQWISVVSAKGTCHIYILSPFGGDTSIQMQNTQSDVPTLLPGLSVPWWSTSSWMLSQQSCLPPPPVTLSVVSRIKNGNSGWLNSVSNAAAYTTGKTSTPSGALAAAFHSCVSQIPQSVPSKANVLEHLLVYTPCGHLVQHELLLSLGVETSYSVSRTGSSSFVQAQDEESRVKVEPVQWWYVCRQSDWPEREECISWSAHDKSETADMVMDSSDCEDNDINSIELKNSLEVKEVKSYERPHWYLSNAEVQISSGRVPIWQKSKISFHVLVYPRASERMFTNGYTGGEFEIEKVPVHEVEVKRKDLLPVFDHFHSIKSDWDDRVFVGGRYPSTFPYGPNRSRDKFKEETSSYHSRPASFGSVEGSDAGSSRTSECLLDLDQLTPVNCDPRTNETLSVVSSRNRESIVISSPSVGPCACDRDRVSSLLDHSDRDKSQVGTSCISEGTSSVESKIVSSVEPTAQKALFSNTSGISEVSNGSSGCPSSSLNEVIEVLEHVDSHDPLDFGQYFQEGYCKVLELDRCGDLTTVVGDADSSSSHCEKEKPEEDEESDDMFGGVFAFSEEG
ncbi:hypothetical protein IFM89_015880 [Coptis chinensis]|uniref:Autophagy-related protein 18h n=1 Tax=Coptis chinensis TaxID=261450 RepID=A0A835HTW5_9MAGN|nr:hypothetical protein IFM89_015880 [Coptis chinensis]